MIIRSKDKVQVGGKNKPVWVLDTDALTVTYNTPDAEPSVTTFSSDHNQVSSALFGGVPSYKTEKARQRWNDTRLPDRA